MPKKEEFYYDSRDNSSKIHAVQWTPDTEKPLFILQIVHGMAEYVDRYEPFAMYMAEKGILVVGADHLGHGKSKGEGMPYGYFCERDAATVLVRDVHRLKKTVQEKYPGIPVILLGHSMGSFILRNYLFRYGTGIQAAIIVGTGHVSVPVLCIGKLVLGIQKFMYGSKSKSELMKALTFGSYPKKIKNADTIMDWLGKDKKSVEAYIADPLCGFTFTVNGFSTLLDLAGNARKGELIKTMPSELPVFIISGSADPVGGYGKGVKHVCQAFLDGGMKHVQMKLYENDRHEILNETDKEKVYADIFQWMISAV